MEKRHVLLALLLIAGISVPLLNQEAKAGNLGFNQSLSGQAIGGGRVFDRSGSARTTDEFRGVREVAPGEGG